MDEIKIGAEQELYLAPETEKIKNADEIAEISLEVEKYPFIIGYDANEKENIVTELLKLGCDEIKQLDFANCIAVSMSMAQLKAIKTLVGVERVEKDYDYKCLINGVSESEYSSYLAGVNPQLNSKKEVKLAVFDTGVTNVSVNSSVNFVNDFTGDENGHGTQMAGIISSVVTNAENKVASSGIYSVVVADHRGFAKTSTIMQALDWAINNGIKIVCMSFGDYHKSAFLENMINRASDCGIIMVAAAGNDGGFEDENRIMYPAAFDNVLSVGAKNGDTIADYSNGGENAECFAYGSQSTTDINGNAVNVIGTSAAAALVAGTILKNWCITPGKTPVDIIEEIKLEKALSIGANTDNVLTESQKDDTLLIKNDNTLLDVTELNARVFDEGVSVLCVGDDSEGECSSNDMASAINVPFFSWQSGCISCPGNEIWYKFTTNVGEAHANGSRGWYGIQTQGSLDTVGYLYDSYGNQIDYDDDSGNNMNFKIAKQLDYGETYYVKVMAFGSNTGSFHFKVDYGRDDHGNSIDTATEIVGVYYQDKSVNGYLHSYGDVDYYTFVPARNCVMEIYTEGDTDTYGQLYCAAGGLLDSDTNGNGNGNFKITAHLEAMKRYYIAVSHNSSTGYGDYTLRFKFVKDYGKKENVISATWYNDTYDPLPYNFLVDDNIRCKIWLNHGAAYKWYYDVVTNVAAQSKLSEFSQEFSESLLVDYLVSKLPFSSNYIMNIGASVLLGMLISTGNPSDSKEQFLNAYMNIDPNNSAMAYVCGTAATLVDYYPIVLQPIAGSERDIMGYEYDEFECFYGLPYCRGNFIYKYA